MIMVMIDGDDGDDDDDGDDVGDEDDGGDDSGYNNNEDHIYKNYVIPKDRKKHYLCPQCHIFTPMNKTVHNISLESRFEHVC